MRYTLWVNGTPRARWQTNWPVRELIEIAKIYTQVREATRVTLVKDGGEEIQIVWSWMK